MQLKSLRITNLKCLRDTGIVELKPITILLGQNSSGKSTFLRVLPLLRQTAEAQTSSPLLWFGRLVDFGGFRDAVHSEANPCQIGLSFSVAMELTDCQFYWQHIGGLMPSRRLWTPYGTPSSQAEVEVHIANDPDTDHAYTKRVNVAVGGHHIAFTLSAPGVLARFTINGRDVLQHFSRGIVPSYGALLPIPRSLAEEEIPGTQHATTGRNDYTGAGLALPVATFLRNRMHGNTSVDTALATVCQLSFDTSSGILKQVKHLSGTMGKNNPFKGASAWTTLNPYFQELQDFLVLMYAKPILHALNQRISAACESIRYIEPLRATADRYYRFQDLAVDEIDAQGRNLPMFIHSLSKNQLRDFQLWTETHFGFSVKPHKHEGHLSLHVTEDPAVTQDRNLADAGFGYSQILPIATQLWWQTRSDSSATRRRDPFRYAGGFLAMEQPELHLHPRLQAHVADAFAAAVRSGKENHKNLRIIAETHSEAIVNRLGELIASGRLKKNDVNVVLFESSTRGGNVTVRCAEYDEDGYLENWPYGFFSAGDGR